MRTAAIVWGVVVSMCPLVMADGQPSGQVIGLCYREGSRDLLLEEILRDEGIPYTRIHELHGLHQSGLRGLVIGEGFEDAAAEIESYVQAGGVVLTLRPGERLAASLGLKRVGGHQDGYVTVGADAGARISHEGRLQLFGESIHYEGGEALASLSPDERYAGLVRVRRGQGTALVVAFDLPTTMLTVLQPKSEDVGAASAATNVDYDLGEVPQVDLLRRLIVGELLDSLDVPMNRKWYFPSQHMAMLIASGDQDWATFEQMKATMDLVQEVGAPYTIYLTASSQPITAEQFVLLSQGGIELAFHVDYMSGQPFTGEELEAQLKKVVADTGGNIIGMRPHCCRWETCAQLPAWSERAGLQYESILGIKMWETKPVKPGYWVGTGLPYHVIDEQSWRRLDFLEIPIYGMDNLDFWKPDGTTLVYKEGGKPLELVGLGLDEEQSFQLSKRAIDLAVEKYHTVYSYCWHPHYLSARQLQRALNTTDTHFRQTINYARSCGVGLIGTNAMNDFWRARERVSMTDIQWNEQTATMRYNLVGAVELKRLTLIAPRYYHGRRAEISVDSQRREYNAVQIFGNEYAMWTVDLAGEPLALSIHYQ